MRTWRPGPLDERGKSPAELGGEELNPQLQDQNLSCCRLHHPRMGAPRRPLDAGIPGATEAGSECSESANELRDLAVPIEPAVSEQAPGADAQRLAEHALQRRRALDRARARG